MTVMQERAPLTTHERLVTARMRAHMAEVAAGRADVESERGRTELASSTVELAQVVLELVRVTDELVAREPAAVPVAEPDPSSVLGAFRQIAHLVGRDMTSPASVVDAVAVLVQRANKRGDR